MFRHSAELWAQFPALAPGVLLVDGITDDAVVDLSPYLARAAERLRTGPESQFPEIIAWRRAFAALGVKPTQYRPAAEALLRRYRRDQHLPRVHPLVDLCNAIAMASGVPVAALDVDRIAWPLEVRHATGAEVYLAFSGDVERPDPGEVVFADADGRAHARRWTNRQSARSAVSPATRRALVVVEALHDGAADDVAVVVDTIADAVHRTWGGQPTRALLTATAPTLVP
ncbi:MAG: B3/B4 domain-containing protein [Dermatophilaceae bacterium]